MLFSSLVVTALLSPQGPPLGGLATVPTGPIVTIVVTDPAAVIADALAELDDVQGYADLGIDSDDSDLLEALERFGVQLSEPESWSGAGFDLSRPVRLAVADPGGFLGLPQTAWLVAATSEPGVAQKFMSAVKPGARAAGDVKPIVYVDDEEGWCVRGGEVFVMSTTASKRTVAERLRDIVIGESERPTIGADPLYGMMAKRVKQRVRGALFLDVAAFRESPPIRAFLVTLTDESLDIGIACDDAQSWAATTRPGQTSREMLARFDRPAVAISASLADPIAALETVDGDRAHIAAFVERVLGEDSRRLLANSAGGLVLYPSNGKLDDARFAACVRSGFAMQIFAELVEAAESDAIPFEVDDGWLLGDYDGRRIIIGRARDFVVFGDAVDEIRRAARTKHDAWDPIVGGRELFAVEVDPLALGLAGNAAGDPEQIAALEQTGRLSVRVASDAPGFVVSVRFDGAQGDETFLRRLIRACGAVDFDYD